MQNVFSGLGVGCKKSTARVMFIGASTPSGSEHQAVNHQATEGQCGTTEGAPPASQLLQDLLSGGKGSQHGSFLEGCLSWVRNSSKEPARCNSPHTDCVTICWKYTPSKMAPRKYACHWNMSRAPTAPRPMADL